LYKHNIIHDVCHHVGFVVQCTSVVPKKMRKWFRKNQIKIQYVRYLKTKYSETWYLHGEKHRDDDLPAEITYYFLYPKYVKKKTIAKKSYYQHGQLHRDNYKPAVVDFEHGRQEWWIHGEFQYWRTFNAWTFQNF
jgi:hypothetical protein